MKKYAAKEVVSKTVLFIGILLFIIVFKAIFGDDNVKIGVTILITMLMLLQEDLTKKPIRNFLIIMCTNLIIGIGAYIAANNVILAVFINFLMLSIIGYIFSYAMTKGLILPFGLQYLFILYEPVYGDSLRKRWMALASGAVIVMISQLLIHAKKDRTSKNEQSIINLQGRQSDKIYTLVNFFGKEIKIHTIRASYAIRVGILTALTAFITQYFKLAEGRWMVYTVFSLTEFYSENTKIKAVKRLEGTIIGGIILVIFFYFVKDSNIRGLLMLLAGFLNSFASDYRDQMILTTVSAVTPVALVSGSNYAVYERIIYVIIGTCISVAASKLIFPKSKKDYQT